MKRHTGPTSIVAPRRLLLQEHAAANATTTNSTSSGSKATPVPPPHPPTRNRYYPSDMPSPDPNGTTDTVRFDSSSVAVTALVILSALFFLGFFSVYARRFFAPDWDNPDPSASRRRRLGRRGRVPGPAATASGRGYGGRGAPRGLDPEAIKALPLVRYSEEAADQKNKAAGDGDDNDHRCCAVCLGEFEEGEELRAIPRCGHAFHRECIDAWLSAHGSCPLCRTTDLFGAAKGTTPQMRCEVCRLESVVVVPSSQEAASAAGQGEGGSGQRRPEGGNGQQPTDAAPSAASTPVAPQEAREIGVVGRSRSWLCMSAAAESEKPDEEKGPQPQPQVAGREEQEQPPHRSCS